MNAVDFFYEHAGYSYDPKTETQEQGRRRCAESLASAEKWAKERGYSFRWEDDWDLGMSHERSFGEAYQNRENGEPNTCEACYLLDEDDEILQSLGCIDDADNNYRRVIEAELADQERYDVANRRQT